MQSHRALAEFERHQALIRAEMTNAAALVAQQQEGWIDALAQARWRMFRLLRAYQLFKHAEIYDPAIQSSDISRSTQARTLKASCIETAERYRAYTLQWSVDAMVRDVRGYREAQKSQAAHLRQQLTAELAGVKALLGSDLRHQESSTTILGAAATKTT